MSKQRRWVSDHLKIATERKGKTIWKRVVGYRCRGLGYHRINDGWSIVHLDSGHEVLKVGLPVDVAQVAGWILDEGERRGLNWTWVQKSLWAKGAKDVLAEALKRYGQ
jgi:hypothetical protein